MKFLNFKMPTFKRIFNRLSYYAEPVSKLYGIPKWKLYIGFFKDTAIYGCAAMDYFLYKFFLLNSKGKKRFVTVKKRVIYDSRHNSVEGVQELVNKEEALVKFQEFIHRDWCGQKYHNTEEEYAKFSKKHDRCIIKPMENLGGQGIRIIPTEQPDGKTLYELCKEKCALVEELIVQHKDMLKLYPNAVNTIRVVTVKGQIIATAVRMGAGGGEIDNAHAGGIFAAVDPQTGIITTVAHKYTTETFIKHPDTQTVIPGFQIPMWEEVLQLVKQAAKKVEAVALVGWDVCISEKGPTIVEVNHMPALELVQAPEGNGLMHYFK